ncbi:DUF3108 domain-containing protein [Hydrogenophaga palleronii]|uniref:DUF3108 domain-containing protein n=1 Tax=Hydrogenophaga palleronii TaxID=65655 RepID=UPI0008266CAA|nr:DUF3108 domain-containing protein [Hydrogenophaga palleronii]
MNPNKPATPSVAPRWPTLSALVLAVLGLHAVLLTGGLPLNLLAATVLPDGTAPTPHTEPKAPSPTDSAITAAAPRAPLPAAVQVSTVRWIVPAPAPEPAPVVVAPPRPKPVKRVAPKPAPVEPVVVAQAPAAPEPEPQAQPEPTPVPVAADLPPPAAPAPPILAQAEAPAPAPAEAPAAPAAEHTPPATKTAAALPPAQAPASARLPYDVTGSIKGIHYKAQGTLDWTLADGRYDARMEMRVMLLGSRSQTSTGRVGPHGLEPERFGDKSRSEKAAHFDAAQHTIRFSSNAPEVPLLPGAQDRLSLFMQIAALLQARPQAYAAGQTIEMQVAGTGDAPVWQFQVGEESSITVPAGEFKVRHLVRQPRKEFDSTVEMWLAPSLHHLPVRLRVTQANGDVADQQLNQMP